MKKSNIAYAALCGTSLSLVSPAYALNEWQAGLAGAGLTAATLLTLEHFLIPFVTHQWPAKKLHAAQLIQKQKKVQEIKQRCDQEPLPATTSSEDLLNRKQSITQDLQTVRAAEQQWKSSGAHNAEQVLKEIDSCKATLQQHEHAIDQALAQCITEEAYACFQEELEYLKGPDGLDAHTLERIIVENYVRDPYRRHTYLGILDHYIARCRQCNAPSLVVNSLEILRKQASRLLEPSIIKERLEHETVDRRMRESEVEIASKRSIKDFFDTAQKDLSQARNHVEESRQQIAHFTNLAQQQNIDNASAVSNCTMVVQNATSMLVQVHQEQEQLRRTVTQLDETVRAESLKTRNAVHTEGTDIKRQIRQDNDNDTNNQAPGNQSGPSAQH